MGLQTIPLELKAQLWNTPYKSIPKQYEIMATEQQSYNFKVSIMFEKGSVYTTDFSIITIVVYIKESIVLHFIFRMIQ